MKATIYTKYDCPFCVEAKKILDSIPIMYEEKLIVSREDPTREELKQRMGPYLSEGQKLLVPQIWIDDIYIGGCDKLKVLITEQLQ